MALHRNHHVGFIQHKHGDLLGVEGLLFGAPVVDGARRPDDDLLLHLGSFRHWKNADRLKTLILTENPSNANAHGAVRTSVAPDGVHQLDIRAKLPHLLHHLTDLQSQLVRGRDAKALKAQKLQWQTRVWADGCFKDGSPIT